MYAGSSRRNQASSMMSSLLGFGACAGLAERTFSRSSFLLKALCDFRLEKTYHPTPWKETGTSSLSLSSSLSSGNAGSTSTSISSDPDGVDQGSKCH